MAALTNPLALLQAAPEEIHPALLLAWELKRRELAGTLETGDLLALAPAIDAAIKAAEGAVQFGERSLRVLHAAAPVAAPSVPEGF